MQEPDIYDFDQSGLNRFYNGRDTKIQEILVRSAYGYRGMTPTEYFSKTVLHQTFDQPDDEFDRLSWQLLDDDEQAYTAIANHRGDGKTARTNAKIIRGICFRLVEFILYLQAIQDDAVQEMDNVKAELAANDFIQEVWGDMKAKSFEGLRKSYGRTAWFACNPIHPSVPKERQGEPFCFVLPRGATQRIRGRGINIGGKRIRPRWVFGDDIEDDESVLDSVQRQKLKNWWFGSVIPIVSQRKFPRASDNRWDKPKNANYTWQPPYRFQMNGTILGPNSLMSELLADSMWKSVRIPMGHPEERDGKTIYVTDRPDRISSEQLTAMADTARKGRYLDTFYRERLCIAVSRENACWTRDLFQYMTLERDKELQDSPEIIRLLIVDPSKSASQSADLTGIVAVAIAPRIASIYVRRAVALHLNSNEIPKAACDMAVETNSQMIFTEIIGQHGVVDVNFKNYLSSRGLPVQLFWLHQGHTPKGDYGTGHDAIKAWRGQQILPYYQDRQVFHHPTLQNTEIEEHMLDYPRPTEWCFIDCAGYIPACMAELGVQFAKQPQYANIARFKQKRDYDRMTDEIRKQSWAVHV